MTDKKLDELTFKAWQQHRGQYGFTMLTNSICPYSAGFKDGFKMALELSNTKSKPEHEAKVTHKHNCTKCKHYEDLHIYTYDTLGHCHIVGCKEPSNYCKKCIDTEYNMWEKDND